MSSSITEQFVQASSTHESLLRKVDFHQARKPTSYFTTSSSDFKPETLAPSTSTAASIADPHRQIMSSNFSASSKKPDCVDHDIGSELSLRITFRRIGAGLENLGNTCFLNSVVQCLTYTEPLAAYLQSGKHQTSCRVAGFCALCAFQKHVSCALQSGGRSLVPKDLVSNLQCISRSFRKARQEDAHEYMIQLLECMHKCCLPSGVPTESPSAYEKSLVHKIFGGRLRSQVKCMQCSHCSNKFDPFLDLSLEIIKADSLYKALVHFTAAEQLDGGQKQYNCERCRQKVRALKQLTVHKAPYVLTVHLKRFGSLINDQKIGKKVHFGATLDLKPFVSGSYEGDLKYTLYGVLVHAGWSTRSGHYYCFVRTSTGTWYSLDDDRVYQVSEKTVLDQKAYMLFYVHNRKNVTPKKPVDVIQRGSMFKASVQNISFRTPENHSGGIQYKTVDTHLRKSGQNGSIPEQHNGRNTYNLPFQWKSSSANSLNDEEFAQKCHGMISSKFSSLRERTVALKPDTQVVTHNMKCTDETPSGIQSMTADSAGFGEDKFSRHDLLASDVKLSGVDCLANIVDDATPTPQVSKSDHVVAAKVHNGTVSKNIDLPESSSQKMHSVSSVNHANFMPEKSKHRKTLKQSTHDKIQRTIIAPKVTSGHVAHVKLKFFMCKSASMHLGRNILYGRSLSLRKRKKHKRTKWPALKIHPNSVMDEHHVTADVGPSTSDRMTSYDSSKHSHRRCQKSGSRKRDADSAQEDLMNDTAGPQKNIKRKLPVGQWLGVELPSEIPDSKGSDNFHIGHVLDEWDEEYDRGKRKKLKRQSRIGFGGSNRFQEISIEMAKLKR